MKALQLSSINAIIWGNELFFLQQEKKVFRIRDLARYFSPADINIGAIFCEHFSSCLQYI